MVYRFATPNDNREPILNYNNRIEVSTNVGVIFFKEAESSYVGEISNGIKKLNIEGEGEISYKYNTDADCYKNAVDALVNENGCKDIIVTSSLHYDTLKGIADEYKDTDFYVLWGTELFSDNPPRNIQICRIDITRAMYSIGVNSAHYLTEKIKAMDITDPSYSETNHTVVYLYKTDIGKSHYENFVTGVKKVNPNLSIYQFNVTDEAQYASTLTNEGNMYAVMLADEMPDLVNALSQLQPENIYISGTTDSVKGYSNYLCAIKADNNTYLEYIFHSIAKDSPTGDIYNGSYEDNFCRIDYNKAILGNLK